MRPSAPSYLKICSQSQLNFPINSPFLTTAVRAVLGRDKLQFRLQFDREGASSQASTITRYVVGGDDESSGIVKTYSSDDYAENYLSISSGYDQETMQDMGFDRSFLQSDFAGDGKGGNASYILLTPNTNLSKLGITEEMIENAIDPSRVHVTRDPFINLVIPAQNITPTPPAQTPTFLAQTPTPPTQTPRQPQIVGVIKEQYEIQKRQDLIKTGVTWLTVIYSLPEPKEILPDLGEGVFEHPDPKYLINASPAHWGEVPPNQVLVMIDSILGFEEARALASRLAVELKGAVVGEFQYINLFQIETQSRTLDELTRDVYYARNYNLVVLAFPNQQVYRESDSPLDDRVYQGESGKGYEIIGVKESWDIIRYSKIALSEVHVGVTDDGLYKGYREFDRTDINTSIELYPEAPPCLLDEPLPEFEIAGSHGTGVMNILVADVDDGGLVGIASPALSAEKKIKIDLVNIFDENRAFITTSLLGLKSEIENGCSILSCSWGNSDADEQVTEMYEEFFKKLSRDYPNLLFIFSAGNDGMDVEGRRRIPNGLPNGPLTNAITVGNIFNNGSICVRSNRNQDNQYVTLGTPGEEAVWGRDNSGRVLNYQGGTSMATPQVTAAACLIRSINPGLNAGEIKNILIETGHQNIGGLAAPKELGGRVLSVDEAVKKAIDERLEKVETNTDTSPNVELPEIIDSDTSAHPDTDYRESGGFDATVTIRSVQYKGYDVRVNGNLIGTDGKGQDPLDGIYTFKVTGNQQHLIRVDHPLNWKWWQYFYAAGDNYDYEF
ncbi:MAG: hypothetical protein E4G89_02685 [Methanothrix sp.]|nr:MAG: hypothetical protein E4G89_02685 [Methanothrix sp.]